MGLGAIDKLVRAHLMVNGLLGFMPVPLVSPHGLGNQEIHNNQGVASFIAQVVVAQVSTQRARVLVAHFIVGQALTRDRAPVAVL